MLSESIQDKWFRILVFSYNKFIRTRNLRLFKKRLKVNQPKPKYTSFYSDAEREVDVERLDGELTHAIVTCYFTKKADPQFGIIRARPDINYIKPWYDSIVRLKLNGIIIHDGLDQEFIDEYKNNYIQFRKCVYGNYSIFEERWFAYYLFLVKTNIKWVFFTDINDVVITSNPFEFASKADTLYIGRDNASKIRKSKWLLDELENFRKDSGIRIPETYKLQHAYNAGVVGGERKVMLFFISKIIDLVLNCQTDTHKDMTLVNLIIHKYFPVKLYYDASEQPTHNGKDDINVSNENLISGFPLNSLFKNFDTNSKAIFIHK
jgi:hypothetical protein